MPKKMSLRAPHPSPTPRFALPGNGRGNLIVLAAPGHLHSMSKFRRRKRHVKLLHAEPPYLAGGGVFLAAQLAQQADTRLVVIQLAASLAMS